MMYVGLGERERTKEKESESVKNKCKIDHRKKGWPH